MSEIKWTSFRHRNSLRLPFPTDRLFGTREVVGTIRTYCFFSGEGPEPCVIRNTLSTRRERNLLVPSGRNRGSLVQPRQVNFQETPASGSDPSRLPVTRGTALLTSTGNPGRRGGRTCLPRESHLPGAHSPHFTLLPPLRPT